jgi:hypothetical protein
MDKQNKQNDEMNRKLGGSHQEDENLRRQSPGRNPEDEQSGGRRTDDRENVRIGEDEDRDTSRRPE